MFFYVKGFSFKNDLGHIYFLQQFTGLHGPIKKEL